MAKEKNPKRLVDVFSATTKGFGADILPAGFGYNKKYRYKVNLHQYGVGYDIITWCLKNCKSKFSLSYYYFDLLEEWFPKDEYIWKEKEFVKAAAAKPGVKQTKGTELLIMNYEI